MRVLFLQEEEVAVNSVKGPGCAVNTGSAGSTHALSLFRPVTRSVFNMPPAHLHYFEKEWFKCEASVCDRPMSLPLWEPCNAGVTRAEGGGILYAAGHREIMAIPPQLAHTIEERGGSEDSSFNQAIVWANYI
ncbi:unnamed protein product [Pleuronectes platessa]|uniref:Uncharacterized protein n=1 Tax=Pleuronectes platessa TaxID=8262 RepID=A0A9N7U5T1_PLEPL|nr:unnamed protein product [Pleuronectes platessa]